MSFLTKKKRVVKELSEREKRIALTGAYFGYWVANSGRITIDNNKLFKSCLKSLYPQIERRDK